MSWPLTEGSKADPLVTFIILAYNQECYVSDAIDAAFAQTYSPLEILIADDCSTDGTFSVISEKVSKYAGRHTIRAYQNERNLGLAGNLNEVLSHANGDIITWAAADDIALPNRTEAFVSLIDEKNYVIAAHSAVVEMDEAGKALRTRRHPDDVRNVTMSKVLEQGSSIVTQSCAFHRSVVDRFGPFSNQLTNEGKAMAFRVAASGRIAYVDEPLTFYRMGSGVSTYNGRDVARLKKDEPIKITGWYLSAYKQMLADCQHLREDQEAVRGEIQRQIKFYENLYKINTGAGLFCPLWRNFIAKPKDLRSLRAVLRRLTPTSLYSRAKVSS